MHFGSLVVWQRFAAKPFSRIGVFPSNDYYWRFGQEQLFCRGSTHRILPSNARESKCGSTTAFLERVKWRVTISLSGDWGKQLRNVSPLGLGISSCEYFATRNLYMRTVTMTSNWQQYRCKPCSMASSLNSARLVLGRCHRLKWHVVSLRGPISLRCCTTAWGSTNPSFRSSFPFTF